MDQPTLIEEVIDVERKTFFIELKENPRGRFVRLTEDVRGRRDTIIIPISGVEDIRDALDRILDHEDTLEPVEEYED